MDITDAKINNAIKTLEAYIDELNIDEDTKADLHVLVYMTAFQYTAHGIANALSITFGVDEEAHYQEICNKYEESLETNYKAARKEAFTVIKGEK